MDVVVPSAIVENDFYCGRYARDIRPSVDDLEKAYGASFKLAVKDYRLARCSSDVLRQAGAPDSFIGYLDSNLWGTYITPAYVDGLLQRLREERQAQMNAPTVDEDGECRAPLEDVLASGIGVS